MKIVQVINYFAPQLGYQETFFDLEMRKKGFKTFMITSDRFAPFPDYENSVKNILGPRKFSTKERKNIKKMGFKVINLRLLFEYYGNTVLLGLWGTLDQIDPDLIIAHGIYSPNTISSYLWALRKRKKIVIDEHMLVMSKNPLVMLWVKFVHTIYRVLPDPTLVFVVSDQLLKHWKKKDIFKKAVLKIPLGVDLERFFPNKNLRKIMRKRLGIPTDTFILFYAGKIIHRKGLEDMIFFASRVRDLCDKDVRILIVGSGSPSYLRKIKNIGTKAKIPIYHVDMVPNEDLLKYMQVADLGCWFGEIPSAAVQELAGVGTPVLCKKTLQASAEISWNLLKMYYDPDNIDNTAKKLCALISNNNQFQEIVRLTRKYAEKNLSYEASIRIILKKTVIYEIMVF